MDTLGLALVVALFTLLFYLVFPRFRTKTGRLPPGPRRLPLVGSLIQMAMYGSSMLPHEIFEELAKKYGPIIFLRNGATDMVVVNGYDAVRRVLTNDQWLERSDRKILLIRLYEKRQGIAFANLDLWKASRKYVARTLRDFGFGKKNTMELFIKTETAEMKVRLDKISEENGGKFETKHFFSVPVINVLWAFITGFRFSPNDPQIRKLVNNVYDLNTTLSLAQGILVAYPKLQDILPESWLGLPEFRRIMGILPQYLENVLDDFRRKGTYRTNPQSLVEVFLQQIDEAKEDSTSDKGVFTDENLVSVLSDIFSAGSDSTSDTLEFTILWLTINQEVQKKLRDELVQFINVNGRQPTLSDSNLYPDGNGLSKSVSKGVSGGTEVLVNLHSVLMEASHWGDPKNFRPERFLDSTNQIVNSAHVIPFSLGKRNCMGEALAEASIFLMTTFLFSKYEFLPIEEAFIYDTSPLPRIALSPKPFSVRIKRL